MTRRSSLAAGTAVTCLLVASAAGMLQARNRQWPLQVSTDRLLYNRDGGRADRMFLTFDALASDVYWIRTIQHYGRDRRSTRTTDRYALLQPLLDLTTTLDPYFNVAYRFGAILLALEAPNGPGRPDEAIALLQKGLRASPNRWQYAHDIGFVHYWHTGDHAEAARWFERAASMPGAPEWLRPLAANALLEGGDRQTARQLFAELMHADQDYVRVTAERALAQLQALDAIDVLQVVAVRYEQETGHRARGWDELVHAGRIRGLPLDPAGVPFDFDAATGLVSLSRQSPLHPLPQKFARKQ